MPPTHRSAERRPDAGPPKTGPAEKEVLVGFLDYLRASVAAKAQGVPEPQIRTPGVASGTNLLGLVKHLTHVERHWLLGQPVTDWKATFHPEPEESADDILRAYRETTRRANEVVAACPDPGADGPRPGARPGPAPSLRWTLTHMIEETGRHAGHADILRELIDGSTGR
ncbi:DinB family protein [Streptomonospora litoralis]|uniref:DinB superfamily protein n=1 Tax=Streptomonospora litoralis TaxID=2498135 RepID=A0A4V0ZJI1_9ACTN|nr:DinB family protein [Streptomonospora litoralis]QBI53562.1 DinB superfamily protein [Streptomonospora litoralis]